MFSCYQNDFDLYCINAQFITIMLTYICRGLTFKLNHNNKHGGICISKRTMSKIEDYHLPCCELCVVDHGNKDTLEANGHGIYMLLVVTMQ